jgi:hypothetical protein
MDNGQPLIPTRPPVSQEPALQSQHDRDLAMLVGKPKPVEAKLDANGDMIFNIPKGVKGTDSKEQSSGGDNDYWVANVTEPKRLDPYKAEAEDLIELFQFSFAEGNAFKALWRMGMDRVASGKPGDTPLRNAEKVAYYGTRMVKAEQKKLK